MPGATLQGQFIALLLKSLKEMGVVAPIFREFADWTLQEDHRLKFNAVVPVSIVQAIVVLDHDDTSHWWSAEAFYWESDADWELTSLSEVQPG